ncbi:MAG: GDSL-type esterase/lipase family protein [Candidatus Erginobacter occultus]|nr:GDSL-type esterase/lipase family protein [Candidatus Erginobacter occultus]
MKRVGLAILLILQFLSPAVYSQELYSIGEGWDQSAPEIVLGVYRDGAWEETAFLPAGRFDGNFRPALAVSPAGELWVAWVATEDSEKPKIYFSHSRVGSWTEPRRVTAGGDDWEMTPVLAFGPDGTLLAAWSGERDDLSRIYCSRWKGDGFGPAEPVSSAGVSPVVYPALAVASAGRAILVWQGWDGVYYRVFYSLLDDRYWLPERTVPRAEGADQVKPSVVELEGGDWECSWAEDGELRLAIVDFWGRPEAVPRRGHAIGEPPSGWVVERDGDGQTRARRTGILSEPSKAHPGGQDKPSSLNRVYIGFGDSITAGWDGSGGYPAYYSYIPYLKTMLQNAYGGTFTIYNEGYGGYDTGEMLSIINSVLSRRSSASRILIMGGTNDFPDSTSTASNNLAGMVDRARGRDCAPVLATIIPKEERYSWQADLNTKIYNVAKSKKCLFANPWQAFLNYGNWPNLLISYDNLHPNQKGAQVIADAFFYTLAPPPSRTPTPTPTRAPSPTPTPVQLLSLLDSGDYNGNGRADIAVFRPASGLWAVRGVTRVYFGSCSDLPAAGDYDNDGTTDFAVFRGSTGLWAVRSLTRVYFGRSGDLPIPGDYNGDGFCEPAVYRQDTGLWAVRGGARAYFGTTGDIPVPGYYAGDRVKSIGVFRPANGLWAFRGLTRFYFGQAGDRPAPAGYGGEGTTDVAGVFRPATGLWAARGLSRFYYGAASDQPRPAPYDGPRAIAAVFRESSGLWARQWRSRIYFGRKGDIPLSGRVPRPITPTPPATPTPVPTATPTATPSPEPTFTPTATPSPVPTATPNATPSPVKTITPTVPPTATPGPTFTATATPSSTPTATPTPLSTKTPIPSTATPTPTP